MSRRDWWGQVMLGLCRPETVARRWQKYGREWAIDGELARSEWCHAHAAYYRASWVDKLLGAVPIPSMEPPPLRNVRPR